MPKKVSQFVLREQPINWTRAFLAGGVSAIFMMAFIDCYYLMGITPFTYEIYIGSLFLGSLHSHQNWTVGWIANTLIGGIFGILYAYFFEYVFTRSNARLGTLLGFLHSVLAALAFFPFFDAIHEFSGLELFSHFGILGSRLGAPTFILILSGHLLFGSSMGTFYGPVQLDRVQARFFEPGESGDPDDPDLITDEEDSSERAA